MTGFKPNSKPDERSHKMLNGLLEGKSAQRAAVDAGYTVRYARSFAAKMARGLKMEQTMLERAKGIKPETLGNMAKVMLHQLMTEPPKSVKEQISVIRTGLEVDGMLGGPSELHLHQHSTLPPRVQQMLEDKMKEILALKGNEEVIDGAIVSEGAGRPDQGQEDDDGIQVGEFALGFQNRATG